MEKSDNTNKVKILTAAPALVVDGHGIAIMAGDDSMNIQFVQRAIVENQEAGELAVNVVASVRLSERQAKKLAEDIQEMIQESKNLEEK
jgi:hypothetical protein